MSKVKSALSNVEPEAMMQSVTTVACTLIECQTKPTDPKQMEAIATAALRAAVKAHIYVFDEIVGEDNGV